MKVRFKEEHSFKALRGHAVVGEETIQPSDVFEVRGTYQGMLDLVDEQERFVVNVPPELVEEL